ncbi:hypothetical protein V9T40_002391 [Parthenolecanium corni]|uniref:Uncharacterized protein n=1 Tax=Parthenolecanium corni TaxID=536013 RepID=A0AAN9Y5K0_9HEMI
MASTVFDGERRGVKEVPYFGDMLVHSDCKKLDASAHKETCGLHFVVAVEKDIKRFCVIVKYNRRLSDAILYDG